MRTSIDLQRQEEDEAELNQENLTNQVNVENIFVDTLLEKIHF
jgi:hypothetical protein